MSKGILVLVIGVIILGAGVYLFMNNPGAQEPGAVVEGSTGGDTAKSVTTAREAGSGMATGKRSLTAIMDGGNHKCTFASEDPNAKSSGTVYISGDQIRGDFTSVVAAARGVTLESYMLQTGGFVYTWSDASPQGVRTAREAGSGMATGRREQASGQASGQMSFDAGVELDYNCTSWTPDPSKFAVPKSVTFMEL